MNVLFFFCDFTGLILTKHLWVRWWWRHTLTPDPT